MAEAIIIKSPSDIEHMRRAGKIASEARSIGRQAVAAGVSTREIDREIHDFITKSGAIRKIKDGDIVSIDVGATFEGFVGDCAGTFYCGEISQEAQNLINVTRQSFFEALKYARVGYRISDIGAAVQEYAESHGCSVVREYVGHGVGREMHQAPEVPNYGRPGHGPRLVAGMTIAIEPMLCAGDCAIEQLSDGWTVVTKDRSLAGHYENTILITDGDPEILTMSEGFDA